MLVPGEYEVRISGYAGAAALAGTLGQDIAKCSWFISIPLHDQATAVAVYGDAAVELALFGGYRPVEVVYFPRAGSSEVASARLADSQTVANPTDHCDLATASAFGSAVASGSVNPAAVSLGVCFSLEPV